MAKLKNDARATIAKRAFEELEERRERLSSAGWVPKGGFGGWREKREGVMQAWGLVDSRVVQIQA